ncbi:MAG: hypothetical protein O2821_07740 [Chloroflexi bacterium]|nr:hypothetical protein [Chloroflexota bacterium]MDA1227717.1 hypothetical protein [Chloroflexota bacterium]
MNNWNPLHTIALLVLLVLIGIVGLFLEMGIAPWLITMLLMVLIIGIAGHGATGVWLGALIDDRNKVSLSRFQLVLWTIIVISTFLTAALMNYANNYSNPLDIAIPAELWILMGISTTSLVGSPLIKSTKKRTEPDKKQFDDNKTSMSNAKKKNVKDVMNQGLILSNKFPKDASLSDMFDGEETGNGPNLDLAKVQMLFFTLVIVFAYTVNMQDMFSTPAANAIKPMIKEFPALNEGIIALLGISHAGYLTHKAVPLSKIDTSKPEENVPAVTTPTVTETDNS